MFDFINKKNSTKEKGNVTKQKTMKQKSFNLTKLPFSEKENVKTYKFGTNGQQNKQNT